MRIPKNKNILHYLQSKQIYLPAPCNGEGTCGKCKIIIKDSIPLPIEEKLLTKNECNQFVRLACQRNTKEETTINIPNQKTYNYGEDLYHKPSTFSPYIQLKKENNHYQIYRNHQPMKTTKNHQAYGVAIDIGTTTIALAFLNLLNGEVVHYTSFINPQTAYGSDVISRISYAATKERLKTLSNIVTSSIDQHIKKGLQKMNILFDVLYEVSIAANTTMVYLLLNKDPKSLAQAPYKAEMLNRIQLPYQDLFSPDIDAQVTIFEGLDAYIGGDIISGLTSLDLLKSKDYNLFIDLGTNGEIVLLNHQHIYATATALGPAFEGVNITCGTGAIPGAIDHFLYPNHHHTIQEKPPIGLCGSGLIELISELHKHHLINHTGKIQETFHLTDDVFINQTDIRQVQLAKAAVKAGIEHICIDANIKVEDIKTIYIAGGFGQYTNPKHLIDIGMIPTAFKEHIQILGNASLSGAIKFLSSNITKSYTTNHTLHITSLTTPLFQELFVANMHFPFKNNANQCS